MRKDWLTLNGLWNLKLGDGTETRILVPFAIESALSGVMKHAERMTYRRSFEMPKTWSGQQVWVHFGAVDWETKEGWPPAALAHEGSMISGIPPRIGSPWATAARVRRSLKCRPPSMT